MNSPNISFERVLRDSIAYVQEHQARLVRRRRAYKLRRISLIEKFASVAAYFEILSCGHRGELAIGPQRQYIALDGAPTRRRCYECTQ